MDLFPSRNSEQLAHVRRVKQWATETLAQDGILLVTELTCMEPGCPPVETVIARMDRGLTWKIHKRLAEVTRQDVQTALGGSSHV